MVNIAVMGYGTVGSGVIEVLQTNKERIDQRAGDEIHVCLLYTSPSPRDA